MKVKNTGRKIISIGEVTILPGETKVVPDSFKGNSALDAVIAKNYLSVVAEKAAKTAPSDDKAKASAKK